MLKQAIRAAGLAGAGLVALLLALVLARWTSSRAVGAIASAQVLSPASAAGRVLWNPESPTARQAYAFGRYLVRVGDERTYAFPHESQGLTVQNLGDAPTRLLALDATAPASRNAPCVRCALTATLCTESIAPGATTRLTMTAVVVSLSERPVRAVAAGWSEAAAALGLSADATVADVVCASQLHPSAPSAAACPGTALLDAFVRGGASDALQGVDVAEARGAPIGGVVAQVEPVGADDRTSTLDRYEALGLADTGWAPPSDDGAPAESFVYDLPGAWIRSPDGLTSRVQVLNPTGACATVVAAAYRTSNGFRGAVTVTIGAGAIRTIDLDAEPGLQDVNGSAAIRLTSDRPLAASLTVHGTHLSYTVPAVRMPAAAVPSRGMRQLMPLGYQEKVNFAAAAAMARLRSANGDPSTNPDGSLSPAQDPLDRAQGWETNIPVFNPYPERLELSNRMQAEGEPRREFGYPLLPRVQTVFQPGFGLGKPGGDGWGEMFAAPPLMLPLSIAVHSWREARDTPVQIEGWGVRTWTFDWADWASTAPRFIGLPDLGGPAVASPDDPAAAPIALMGAMTDTFGGRIAVQNPLTQTARIAVDTYARGCGYAGTLLRTIDARQRILVDVRDLPGVAHGADAAVVRVLEGAAAAMVELRRPGWFDAAAAPPDVASAYLGTPIDAADAGPLPEPLSARLAVTPTALTVDRAALTPLPVLVGHVPDDARCAAFTAVVDVPWLTATPAGGAFPAVVTLTIDPRRLPIGEATGTLTIASGDATISGSPQRVTVTVTGEAVHVDPGKAYVPYVVRLADR